MPTSFSTLRYKDIDRKINKIIKLFKKCKHKDLAFVCNIHGDSINYYDGYRSIWYCYECERYYKSPILVKGYQDGKKAINGKLKRTVLMF